MTNSLFKNLISEMMENKLNDSLNENYIDSNAKGIEKDLKREVSRNYTLRTPYKHEQNKKTVTFFLRGKGNNNYNYDVSIVYGKNERDITRIIIKKEKEVIVDEKIDDIKIHDSDLIDVISQMMDEM